MEHWGSGLFLIILNVHGQGLPLLPFGGNVWSEAAMPLRIEHTEPPGELVNTTGPAPDGLIPETFGKAHGSSISS